MVPTQIEVKTVESLRQYMELVEELMSTDVPLWYRGASKTDHPLTPSLFRHPTLQSSQELLDLEGRVLQRFRERSVPYKPAYGRERDQDWELLFLMQHFGVPTRLLDWTESPYIALFFALTGAKLDYVTGKTHSPACVWVLQPEAWNRQALSDITYEGAILSIGSDPLESYKPNSDPRYMRVLPVAMFGLHNSPRIVAQRGVFTIFGKDTDSMDAAVIRGGFPLQTLVKIELPADAIAELRRSLFRIGVTDSVVFPDLAGLALELKRFFGYHV